MESLDLHDFEDAKSTDIEGGREGERAFQNKVWRDKTAKGKCGKCGI